MIVVDTNLIGYLFLSSEGSLPAEEVMIKDMEWVAPLLWRSDLRNVLAYYLRRDLLTVSEAYQIMEEAIQMMRGGEYEVTWLHVLNLVATSSCSAYDCEFVALAQELQVPLVTADKQILAQFPETAVSLNQFTTT